MRVLRLNVEALRRAPQPERRVDIFAKHESAPDNASRRRRSTCALSRRRLLARAGMAHAITRSPGAGVADQSFSKLSGEED